MNNSMDVIDTLCHEIHQGTHLDRMRANGYDPKDWSEQQRRLVQVMVEFADLWPTNFKAKGNNHSPRYVVGASCVMYFVHCLFPQAVDVSVGDSMKRKGDPHVVVPVEYWDAVAKACQERGIHYYAFMKY